MSRVDVRASVAQLAAAQWGLLTTSQAVDAGISKMQLSRMAAAGELERVVTGVYATPAAMADEHVDMRALWLSLAPHRTAEERLAEPHRAGVLSHASAAAMHGIGDMLADEVEVTLPQRRQTRRAGLRPHHMDLAPEEVTVIDGLPVTTAARTIADLVAQGHDRQHVADAMADALRRGLMTTSHLRQAISARTGRRASAIVAELLGAAGLDESSLRSAIVTSPIGQRAIGDAVTETVGAVLYGTAFRELVEKFPMPALSHFAPLQTSPVGRAIIDELGPFTPQTSALGQAFVDRFGTGTWQQALNEQFAPATRALQQAVRAGASSHLHLPSVRDLDVWRALLDGATANVAAGGEEDEDEEGERGDGVDEEQR